MNIIIKNDEVSLHQGGKRQGRAWPMYLEEEAICIRVIINALKKTSPMSIDALTQQINLATEEEVDPIDVMTVVKRLRDLGVVKNGTTENPNEWVASLTKPIDKVLIAN